MREAEVKRNGEVREDGVGDEAEAYRSEALIRSDFPRAKWHYCNHQATPSRLE
jgi:hypothetical protein